MSYPSPGPAGSPQPAAGSAYSPGGPYPQPNVRGTHPIPGQRRNQGILIGIVIAVVFAIAGLVIFGIVAKSTGAGGFTWGLVFAFVPVIPVIALYLWLDRYEPEPTKYILFALCWGAFIATLAAIFINTEVSHRLAETGVGGDRSAVFVAPPVEEFAKGSVILLLALRTAQGVRRHHRRPRVRRDGGRRVRLHREHPLLRAHLQHAVRGVRQRRRPAGRVRAVRHPRTDLAVRTSTLHVVHRDRDRRRHTASAVRRSVSSPRSSGTWPRCWPTDSGTAAPAGPGAAASSPCTCS